MERAIIYYAKTGLEATDHFVPKLLEKYCQDNGYEIVAMLSEPRFYRRSFISDEICHYWFKYGRRC